MEFKDLILERRSIRKFKDTKIDDDLILASIEDAKYAPSWKNSQTARYYLVSSKEMLEKAYKLLPEFNQNSTKNAKLVVTTYVKNRSGFNKEPNTAVDHYANSWGAYDLGLNNSYFILSLKDHGLDSLILGLRDEEGLKKLLNIPDTEDLFSVIAVGVRDLEPSIPPKKSAKDVTKVF